LKALCSSHIGYVRSSSQGSGFHIWYVVMTTELHFVNIVVCCFLHMQEFYPDNYIYGMYVAKILLYVLLKL